MSGEPTAPHDHQQSKPTLHKPMMTGAPSEEKPGDESAQLVADAVRSKIEEQVGAGEIKEFVVESYKTQVVAGTNFFLKIRHAPGKYIHARVFRPLGAGKTHELAGVQAGKTKEDQLSYF